MFTSILNSIVYNTVYATSIVVHGTGVSCEKGAAALRTTADHLDRGAAKCYQVEKDLVSKLAK
jgi:hypothetical protein